MGDVSISQHYYKSQNQKMAYEVEKNEVYIQVDLNNTKVSIQNLAYISCGQIKDIDFSTKVLKMQTY